MAAGVGGLALVMRGRFDDAMAAWPNNPSITQLVLGFQGRDAERHAILSASLASQADRLMVAGLRLLDPPRPPAIRTTRPRP